ncbi:MAG: arginyltransferase [Cycloclasticus sp.]
MSDKSNEQQQLALYISSAQNCDYLSEQQSRNVFIAPDAEVSPEVYAQLISLGFRRSGRHIYRPHCETCRRCISTRIDVNKFKASRSQKRILTKNKALTFKPISADFSEQHYQLYLRYQAHKHPGGSMQQFERSEYRTFLCESLGNSAIFETRLDDKLLAVSVTDLFALSMSAVYTFFDPEFASLSLGTYSVLQQIRYAQAHHKQHLYLGYYVRDSQKMNYKSNFRPLEMLIENRWLSFEKASDLPASSGSVPAAETF